jgi:hypothetical protein
MRLLHFVRNDKGGVRNDKGGVRNDKGGVFQSGSQNMGINTKNSSLNLPPFCKKSGEGGFDNLL